MGAVDDKAIGRRVRDARRKTGFTQGDLGQMAGLNQSKISLIESGERRLSTVEMADIAAMLHIDPLDLLEDDSLLQVSVATRAHSNGDITAGSDSALGILRTMRMLERDGLSPGFGSPPSIADMPKEQSRLAATKVREHLGLGLDPVPDLLEACAEVGLAVRYEPFDDDFDGVCVSDANNAVAVVNTTGRRGGRQRFTLAHELGHWVLGHLNGGPCIDIDVTKEIGHDEQEANRFASEFLLPPVVVSDVQNAKQAVQFAYSYGLSKEAMAVALERERKPDVARELRSKSAIDLASDADRLDKYRADSDAQGRMGITVRLEQAVRSAVEAGALSARRAAATIPDFDDSGA